jgi:hypothetical protein
MLSNSVTDIQPSPDALTAHLEGEAVLLHIGTKQYFRLNRTGAHIWKELEAGATAERITQSLVDTFDVPRAEAEEAVNALLSELVEHKLVRESKDEG